jgi:phage protein U
MRAQAAGGKPLVLPDGHGGFVLGTWVILKIEESKSELMGDGSPRVINFSMTLKEYGEDQGGLGGLGLALAALSTVARLV